MDFSTPASANCAQNHSMALHDSAGAIVTLSVVCCHSSAHAFLLAFLLILVMPPSMQLHQCLKLPRQGSRPKPILPVALMASSQSGSWASSPKHTHWVPHLEKSEMCGFYAAGHCLRGDRCHYAHSEEELRPRGHKVRKTGQTWGEPKARAPPVPKAKAAGKPPRAPKARAVEAKPPVPQAWSGEEAGEAEGAHAASPWRAKALPKVMPTSLKAKLLARQRPNRKRGHEEEVEAVGVPEVEAKGVPEPRLGQRSGRASCFGRAGPFGPTVWLGTQEEARNPKWLQENGIGVLVRCKGLEHVVPKAVPTGVTELNADLFERETLNRHDHLERIASICRNAADLGHRADEEGILFWCKAGRHRSAAMLACYLLWSGAGLTAAKAMASMVKYRPEVEFHETAVSWGPGSPKPPLRPVVEQFYQQYGR